MGLFALVPIAMLFAIFGTPATRAGEGLTLVVPVVAAAVLGGRWAAYIVAAGATLAFSLIIPPVGSPDVKVGQDFVALCIFLGVALVVSTLVARRVETLGQVEQQRRLLLRSVSHDLRTPLSSIRAASTELLDGARHDVWTQTRLLELISDESERLDRLVENLLDLSRIEAGALVPSRQAVDIAELVEVCRSRLQRVFRDVALRIDLPAEPPVVDADFTLIGQVLTNLLENAARHSAPGTEVVLAGRLRPGWLDISVSDSGPGVDPADAARIFEPFRSGSLAGTSGIGLAISQAIVVAHGGTITVGESEIGGAEFIFTLPTG